MPPCRSRRSLYITYRIRTSNAMAEVIKLRDKLLRSTVWDPCLIKLTKASEGLQFLLQLLRYRSVDTSRPYWYLDLDCPSILRPFLRAKNQKLCLLDFFSKLRRLADWQLEDCNRHINCDHQGQKPEFLTGFRDYNKKNIYDMQK